MGDLANVTKLTFPQLAALIALFLPGFVSIKADRLIHPSDEIKAPELIVDSFAYSVVNAILLLPAIRRAFQELALTKPDYVLVWGLGVLVCLAGPIAWPVLARLAQRTASRRKWILGVTVMPGMTFFCARKLTGS